MLRAIGADEDLAHSSIRFGVGRFTTEEEVGGHVKKDNCSKISLFLALISSQLFDLQQLIKFLKKLSLSRVFVMPSLSFSNFYTTIFIG